MKLMAEGTMKILCEGLTAAGKKVEVFEAPDGTRLLLLPHGARILGLYAAGSEQNFYAGWEAEWLADFTPKDRKQVAGVNHGK